MLAVHQQEGLAARFEEAGSRTCRAAFRCRSVLNALIIDGDVQPDASPNENRKRSAATASIVAPGNRFPRARRPAHSGLRRVCHCLSDSRKLNRKVTRRVVKAEAARNTTLLCIVPPHSESDEGREPRSRWSLPRLLEIASSFRLAPKDEKVAGGTITLTSTRSTNRHRGGEHRIRTSVEPYSPLFIAMLALSRRPYQTRPRIDSLRKLRFQ